MSLITNLTGATETPFSVGTSYGEAQFKLFHKTGAGIRRSVVFVSHGFQCYPAQTDPNTSGIYSFAYLIPKNTSLSRTRYSAGWAAEACSKFSGQPLAFATAGVIAAVVGAHGEPADANYNVALESMLDFCDIALFDQMHFSEERRLERDGLLLRVGELGKQILASKDPQKRLELKNGKQEVLAKLALFDNNAIPLVEIVGHGGFDRFTQYLMHCCRPAWPPAGGTSTGAAALTPQGLYAYDDAFRTSID
jgi:hypothetical protein